jgi:hypothetical protein
MVRTWFPVLDSTPERPEKLTDMQTAKFASKVTTTIGI